MERLDPRKVWNEIRAWIGPTRRNIPGFQIAPSDEEMKYFSANVEDDSPDVIKIYHALGDVPSFNVWGSSTDVNRSRSIDYWSFRPVAESYCSYLTEPRLRPSMKDESYHTTYAIALIHAFLKSQE